jgi:hypothetical protein
MRDHPETWKLRSTGHGKRKKGMHGDFVMSIGRRSHAYQEGKQMDQRHKGTVDFT